jgi:chromosomal replication initiator protein
MAAPQGTDGLERRLREAVAERLGSTRYGLWFGEGVRLGLDGDALEVGVPNAFFREWIQGHFASSLVEACEVVTGHPLRLTFRIDDEAEPEIGHTIEPSPADGRKHPKVKVPIVPGALPQVSPVPHLPQLPPSDRAGMAEQSGVPRVLRRLEDFVTGPCNRLAHAAAVEMVRSFGGSYNPLVIHAGVGLGKTHLLEGVAHGLRARRLGLRLVQITAEAVTNNFLDALRTSALSGFRARHRGADALVVDDIQFLAAKRATQDEFLHTFNALINEGVPIIVAADQHPRLIIRLPDELATRLLGGMVVKMEAPDPMTRGAILRAKAGARGVVVPDAVIGYIAAHLRTSVRELEGALHSLIAHVSGRAKPATEGRVENQPS